MFGPFSLPSFCYPPEMLKHMREQREARIKERLKNCVPWDPMMKWVPELNIKADTYSVRNLFPECHVIKHNNVNAVENPGIVSPDGEWLYCIKQVPKGSGLSTWYGSKKGDVYFDGPVDIPAIHQKARWKEGWNEEPWMSHTPAEVISMRGGTKRAKDNVIVAGLGLGYQLIEVSRRRQVRHLTLVERSQSLVDWIFPRVKEHLKMDVDVIVGDAYEVLPKLKADVALVDIDASYGNNDDTRDRLRRTCKDIGHIWCWGAAVIR